MIVKVHDSNITLAAKIHSEAWKESHRSFCNKDFVEKHTVKHQEEYLRNEILAGKEIFMLVESIPVGIISVFGNLIENLYILPNKQHKGYGTQLLLFAMRQCPGIPQLWILSNNQKAYSLYFKHGFRKTGNQHKLSECLCEYEMKCAESAQS